MTGWLDAILNGYRWYRRWRGGIWFHVRADIGQGPMFGWFTFAPYEPSYVQKLIGTEDYATLRPPREKLRKRWPASRFAFASLIGTAVRMADQPGRFACGDSRHRHLSAKDANACLKATGPKRAIQVTCSE